MTLEETVAFVAEQRRHGRTIVFTSGVFDLLHPGHVRFLTAARERGDVLIVGVSSDRSVRASKGPSRPVMPERERAEVLLALTCVDAVVVFDEETRAAVIDRLQPDVVLTDAEIQAGWSTSAIIEKARAL